MFNFTNKGRSRLRDQLHQWLHPIQLQLEQALPQNPHSEIRLVIQIVSLVTKDILHRVHEALIREWRTLWEWIEANREFRIWQERLKQEMRDWFFLVTSSDWATW